MIFGIRNGYYQKFLSKVEDGTMRGGFLGLCPKRAAKVDLPINNGWLLGRNGLVVPSQFLINSCLMLVVFISLFRLRPSFVVERIMLKCSYLFSSVLFTLHRKRLLTI